MNHKFGILAAWVTGGVTLKELLPAGAALADKDQRLVLSTGYEHYTHLRNQEDYCYGFWSQR